MRLEMKRTVTVYLLLATIAVSGASGQQLASRVIGNYRLPDDVLIRITKAEDARNAEPILAMLKNVNPAVRSRAALAAGRIGDEAAVAPLSRMLKDASTEVRKLAAFALGEIESIKAADAVLGALSDRQNPDAVRARLVEAAGKIAAANLGPASAPPGSRNPKAIELGEAVLDVLEGEDLRREKQHLETVRLGLTAALRSRPEGADVVTALFLTNLDAAVRADAANTLARLRSKNANLALRAMLMSDDDPIARANAARALGAAEDKESLGVLIDSAATDDDSRVRVSAIRSLATLRDQKAVEPLLKRGDELLQVYSKAKRPNFIPIEHSEFIEVSVALSRILQNSSNLQAISLLERFRRLDRSRTGEVEAAYARIAPSRYINSVNLRIEAEGYIVPRDTRRKRTANWKVLSAISQGIGTVASMDIADPKVKDNARSWLAGILEESKDERYDPASFTLSLPDVLRAYAAFKPDDLPETLAEHLQSPDVFIRATAAGLIADQPATQGTVNMLEKAFLDALASDLRENDAQLAMLDAMAKIDRAAAVDTIYKALDAPDLLVRKKAFELLNNEELLKRQPGARFVVTNAISQDKDHVLAYDAKSGTKLGQVLNADIDYRRALSRRNGTIKAVFTTQKGVFTIDLLPEDAPLTVDNFVKLARSGYFNGLEVHRVVPNFVMQDGDPIGNGSGGPGWSIRCEVNMVPYERGVVGMALSGKDTGGSQWFVTHSPQPHLDGGYTVFGRVSETGMKVVDKIVRGDKILSVRILGR